MLGWTEMQRSRWSDESLEHPLTGRLKSSLSNPQIIFISCGRAIMQHDLIVA
jgi:hypothetical protein